MLLCKRIMSSTLRQLAKFYTTVNVTLLQADTTLCVTMHVGYTALSIVLCSHAGQSLLAAILVALVCSMYPEHSCSYMSVYKL